MTKLQTLWVTLTTPDDFRGRPYGELTNQMAHALLGVVVSLVIVAVAVMLTGEAPYRAPMIAVLLASYAAMEGLLQRRRGGWSFRDGFADFRFFWYGVGGALLPLEEVAQIPGGILVAYDPRIFLVIVAVFLADLGARVWARIPATG